MSNSKVSSYLSMPHLDFFYFFSFFVIDKLRSDFPFMKDALRYFRVSILLSITTPFFTITQSCNDVFLELLPRSLKKRGKVGNYNMSPSGKCRNDFRHCSVCFQLPHRSSKNRIRAKRLSQNFRPEHQKKGGQKRGKKGESPLGDRRRNDFLHFSYCFQLPHRSLKYRSRAMRSSFHYDPKQQEKMGKKGKTGDISLNDRCRNVFLHAIFHSITTPFFKISQWCNEVVLVFFARITKKGAKNGETKKK